MATPSTKRVLAAAEACMGTAPRRPRSPEEWARLERWGLVGDHNDPNDCVAFTDMFKGIFPPSMTDEDLAEFHRIEALFEEACQ